MTSNPSPTNDLIMESIPLDAYGRPLVRDPEVESTIDWKNVDYGELVDPSADDKLTHEPVFKRPTDEPVNSKSRIYALKCPNCGAALKVGASVDTFACSYCGASVRVEHGEGIISLQLLAKATLGVQRGTDRAAAELAIRRLEDDLLAIETERQRLLAQLTKGRDLGFGTMVALGVIGAVIGALVGGGIGALILGVAGATLGAAAIDRIARKTAAINNDAVAKAVVVREHLSKHQAIADSYDLG